MKKIFFYTLIILTNFLNSQEVSNPSLFNTEIERILGESNFKFQSLNPEGEVTFGFFYKQEPNKVKHIEYKDSYSKSTISVFRYTYNSKERVQEICDELKKAEDMSDYLGKGYSIEFFINNEIYVVYSICSISKQKWNEILSKFNKIKHLYDNKIDCICGGYCK